MKFWFDRTIPKRLAALISVFDTENEICHVSDDPRVSQSTTDVELAALLNGQGEASWIVVTVEIDQRRHHSFEAAVSLTNIRHVLLTKLWTERDFKEQAWRLIRLWPSIVKTMRLSDHQIISVSLIQAPGAFERAYVLETQAAYIDTASEAD